MTSIHQQSEIAHAAPTFTSRVKSMRNKFFYAVYAQGDFMVLTPPLDKMTFRRLGPAIITSLDDTLMKWLVPCYLFLLPLLKAIFAGRWRADLR